MGASRAVQRVLVAGLGDFGEEKREMSQGIGSRRVRSSKGRRRGLRYHGFKPLFGFKLDTHSVEGGNGFPARLKVVFFS